MKSLYEGEYLRIIKKFFEIIPTDLRRLKENQIGKSSNNTNPKQGVKIIANSFSLMNQQNDIHFENALDIYPFFKLTYKGLPNGNIKNIFYKNSKIIRLLNK